ncbi:MAG: ABC transporter permease [Bacteroidetes bacterium]|nr:ABC transporter permease [Bacteroidota bacterium]
MIHLGENIRQGMEAVRSNSLRTIITCMIIAIGIAALVGILTSVDAWNSAVMSTFTRMGSQSFNIRNGENVQRHGGPAPAVNYRPITYNEAMKFKREFAFPSEVSVSKNAAMAAKVSYQTEETNPNVRVIGIDENYLKTASYEIEKGRNFTVNDVDLALPLAIIGTDISARLFKTGTAVGKDILVSGKRYRIVGLLEAKGSSLGMSGGDRVVFVPVTRARQDFASVSENYFINVAVDEVASLDPCMNEAYLFMRNIRGLKARDSDNFVMAKSDAVAREAVESTKMIGGVGTIVAVITLLGAAIGLMNIMLVSVSERTREIGIRKALGATRKTIRNQFLTEAVVICQMGGFGGIILGIILGNIVSLVLGTGFIIPWQWMLVSVIVCMVVGLAAGIYPALRAAKLDPIDSLRYE